VSWKSSAAEPLGDFVLKRGDGTEVRWSEWRDRPALVVAFLGVECPLARLYAVRLEELWQEFRPRGVQVVGVNANEQDSTEEWQAFGAEFELSYPLLKDLGAKVAEQLGATRTPEVVVLDQAGRIRYRGRIDDQYGVGYQRPAATRADLKVALEELLAGQEVSVPETEAAGCFIGRRRTVEASPSDAEPVQPVTPITWSGEVAAIVQRRCQSCHRPGEIAPFSLLEYSEAASWSETIGESVREGRMPPWHANPAYGEFANDARLSDQERTTLLNWVEQGAPEGEPSVPIAAKDAPPWRIGEPDLIVPMSPQPYQVPAEGVVEYQWFHVDPGLKEDCWVRAAQVKPSAPDVVHHATVYFQPPNVPWDLRLNAGIDLLGGYNPGGDPWEMPDGLAVKLPAGSKIIFEMHYTPNGRAQSDQTVIGLVWADPNSIRKQVHCVMPANRDLEIPAGAAAHEVKASYEFPVDSLLLTFRPHMHLRGKSFRYEAAYPDGTREILLDVPHYNFNWQYNYEYAKPKRIPAGTQLVCTAVFDNSTDNPSNPDATKVVSWGDQSWDEMMIGMFSMVGADEDLEVNRNHERIVEAGRKRQKLLLGAIVVGCMALMPALFWVRRGRGSI
jgi:peroxiredoxin/mono/diheme cytochrome c family protein